MDKRIKMEKKQITMMVEEKNVETAVSLESKKTLYAKIEQLVGELQEKFPTFDEINIVYDHFIEDLSFTMFDHRDNGYNGLIFTYSLSDKAWSTEFITQFVIGLNSKKDVQEFIVKTGLNDEERYEIRKDMDETYILSHYGIHNVVSAVLLNAQNVVGRLKDRFLD